MSGSVSETGIFLFEVILKKKLLYLLEILISDLLRSDASVLREKDSHYWSQKANLFNFFIDKSKAERQT